MTDTLALLTLATLTPVPVPTAPAGSLAAVRPAAGRWMKVRMDNLAIVQEVLDSLEAAGFQERELRVAEDGFVVRWR